ncbi:MAG: alkaline phosphatase family protein [Isosphaeraceae bacterium]
MPERVLLLSIPQLQLRDVTPGALASLERVARRGSIHELEPTFPGLAACAFATVVTGVIPCPHGIRGNRFYDRATSTIARAPLADDLAEAPRLWEMARDRLPTARTMLWFPPNCAGADVDFGAWLQPDGSLVTTPDDLGAKLEARFGAFPKPPGGRAEPPRLEVAGWIARTAAALLAEQGPDLAIVRIPYLGQIARRYGPDGREAGRSVRALDPVLAPLLDKIPASYDILAATESIVTPVGTVVRPNQVLRRLGLLALGKNEQGELEINLGASAAFGVTDHQICHIYLNDPSQAGLIAAAFAGDEYDGIAGVVTGRRQKLLLGFDHPRAGDVILVANPDAWFAPDWWTTKGERPQHDASGLVRSNPLGPLDEAQVAGSLGGPSPGPDYGGVLVSTQPIHADERLEATALARLVLQRWPGTLD